jgi:hypothetical protein
VLERTFRGEVRNGTADGVVAACDRRRRHRVDETAPARGERSNGAAVEEFARRVKVEKKAKA